MNLFLFQQINSLAGKWGFLDTFAVFFAGYFGYILIFFLVLFLLKNSKKYWPVILRVVGAAVLARFVIVNLVRILWHSPRPFMTENVNLLITHKPTASFPSGHAAFYFAVATAFLLCLQKARLSLKARWAIGILFFGGAFLISVSRVFAGIHWPLDILAGALVGIFSGWLVILFSQRFFLTAKRQ